jgi:outer membrane PBP1 activator LpoA protein
MLVGEQRMAAMRRRPWFRLGWLLANLLAEAACSLMQPVETRPDPQAQVQRLAQSGHHAEAARGYAELAANTPANRDYFELQSGDQWIAAGNLAAAHQALASVSPDARTKLPILRALVSAELALAENDGARAIRELDQIPVPTQPDEAQSYWWIRGKAAFQSGHPVEGVRAYVERERSLSDRESLRASRQDLYAHLRAAAEHGPPIKPPAKSDPIVNGWLELAPITVELARNPQHASAALAAWKQRFPGHPAADSLATAAQAELAPANAYPNQIALLLPLSGRSESLGVAVRDGFISAYFEQDAGLRPRLRIYDVAAIPVAQAYNQAIEEGASFVVGPLTKEDVAAIAPLTTGRVPVLALNFLSDGIGNARNLYQFALLPEDEARMVARRVASEGRLKGVAIVPDGEWGDRVSAAFADELGRLGGDVLASQRYQAQRADYADVIKQALQIHAVHGEPSTHRVDASFVFIPVLNAGAARQMVPQLKFQYAGDVPEYSTSDAFEPDARANSDIDGLMFPDMPWMISNDPVTSQIRDTVHEAWPSRTARRDPLYAFGFDAYRLVPALRGKSFREESGIAGMTGRLRLDDQNRIRRDLEWAQVRGGVAQAF